MHLPAPPKSAYAARKENSYQRIESIMRAVQTIECLEALWNNERKTIERWPSEWRERIEEERERARARLIR